MSLGGFIVVNTDYVIKWRKNEKKRNILVAIRDNVPSEADCKHFMLIKKRHTEVRY